MSTTVTDASVGPTAAAGGPLSAAARWAAGLTELPDAVAHDVKRAVVDWFAATLPGARMEPAHRLEAALREPGAEPARGAVLLTSGRHADRRTAAVVNGTAAHAAELDDIFREGIYHPGAPTVAAALAVAQSLGSDGERFLRAVLIGFEVSTRIAATIQPSHYRYWHTTGTVGTFGAAAATASLLGADAAGHRHALATAATLAAGLQQAFRSDAMSKPLHSGHAADAGVLSGLAGAGGFTGAGDVLDGPAGFGAAMSDAPDWSATFDDLGVVYNIGAMTVKNHASCGHAFAVIDGVLELRERHALGPDDIEAVEVGTYRTATEVASHPDPSTAFEARFSIPYCVAAALHDGSVRLDAFEQDRLTDPSRRRLVTATTVRTDPELDAGFPGRRAARTSLRLRDGSTVETTRLTRKGDPDDPLTDAELQAKFEELAVPCVGADVSRALADRLWSLEGLENCGDLTIGLTGGT